MNTSAFQVALAALTVCLCANGASPRPSVITVDIDGTGYSLDETDRANVARESNASTATPIANFNQFVTLGDVVEINGMRAKGVWVGSGMIFMLRPDPTAGQAIADVTRGSFSHSYLELLQDNGTPVGTLMMGGFFGGPPPPGSPRAATAANWAITGGTGAFLGARGQVTLTTRPARPALRTQTEASIREDPSRRRVHPPGRADRLLILLIPMNAPEIRAVYHADFSPVSATNPARPGEVLIAAAAGLGPTQPGLDPDMPFPAEPLEVVHSPVDISAGGKPAAVVNKVGWPGMKGIYRVDFRVPPDVAGEIPIDLKVAWIQGAEFRIAVR